MPAQFYLSATRKSSGKTTLSIGLSAALAKLDKTVQCFKKGPDYIDPIWLTKASGQATYNLDFNTQSNAEINNTYARQSQASNVVLIEGNKGLFDGVASDGSNSNAALAKLLDIPVVLVIDCQGMSRGIAPLLLGYAGFDQDINYAGVILNKTGGRRHEQKLRQAVSDYTDLEVFGCMARNEQLTIEERHLGLIPANERHGAAEIISMIASQVSDSVDLDALLRATQKPLPKPDPDTNQAAKFSGLSLAIARDSAFGFYYADDLDYLRSVGVDIHFFDTLTDVQLPEVDGLFLGGGFPETHAAELAINTALKQNIKTAIENGLPTYAECGGLMYLCETLATTVGKYEMVGVIDADIEMHKRPQGRGYCVYEPTSGHPWSGFEQHQQDIFAHEFHYAQMTNFHEQKFAYQVNRGYGINGSSDGVIRHNLLANFVHLRHSQACPWLDHFLNFVKEHKLS